MQRNLFLQSFILERQYGLIQEEKESKQLN